MKIFLHKDFKKKYIKLSKSQKKKFIERTNIFLRDQFHPILNNHELGGEYKGYRSINITGDLRVHYEPVCKDSVLFITVGTHSNLYK